VLRYADGEYVVQWVNSTRCADKYSERVTDPEQLWFASEFQSDHWICPDIDEIEI